MDFSGGWCEELILPGRIHKARLRRCGHSIFPEDDIKKKRQEIIDSVKNVSKGKGVIILTDMFGSTPSNIAKEFSCYKNVKIVSGINLSMLLNIFNYPNLNLDNLTLKAIEGGRDGVVEINDERKKTINKK